MVLAARNRTALQALAGQIADEDQVLVQPTDVTDPIQCRLLIEAAVGRFQTLDCLVLNAGVSMWSRFDQVTDIGIFQRLMETNYLSVVYCVHAALPHLLQSHGLIVAVTSAQAVIGLPNHSAYSASKHAVRGLLESLELELAGAVKILQVMPGWIRGTNLRAAALQGDGRRVGDQSRTHGKDAVTVKECSRRIVEAMAAGKTELYVPSKLRFVPWLKLLAPGWLQRKIRRAVNRK